jgi:NifU-like protein involved in Fe-S cluster formation
VSVPTYSALVTRHFDQPVKAGPLRGGHGTTCAGSAGRRALGAEIRFEARIEDDRIAEIVFRAYGCPHTIAACSLACERLEGAPVQALGELEPAELAAALAVPVDKTGRLLLVQDALHHCLQAWENSGLA